MTLPHLIPFLCQLTFILFLPVTLILLTVSYCYKYIIKKCATLFDKDLVETLQPSSIIYATDDTTINPWYPVTATFTFQGIPTRQRVFQDFEKLLELRSAQDDKFIYWKLQAYVVKWKGYFWWKHDKNFSLRNHIRFIEGDVSSFQNTSKFHDKIVRQPFGVNKPLWGATIISKKDQKTSVMIFRICHTLMDGFSFLKMYHRLGGFENLPKDVPKAVSKGNLSLQRVNILAAGMFFGIYEYLKTAETSKYANSASSFTDQSLKTGEWLCAFVPGINLSQLKAARQILKCSFLDLLLSGFLGGTRKFMEKKGAFPDNMNLGVTLPKPNHPDEQLINHFYYTILRLPLNIIDLEERTKAIKKASKGGRPTPLVGFLELVAEVLSILPIANIANEIIDFDGFSGISSFMPGGEKFAGIFGLESQSVQFSVPVGKLATMTCAGLTGNGKVWLSLMADSGVANDPADMETLAECIHEEFEDIFRLTQKTANKRKLNKEMQCDDIDT